MSINIRPYEHSDFDVISSWWLAYNEVAPIEGMMIVDGTFILELDNVPSLSLTVLLTQSKEMSYIEGFIKNPLFKGVNLESYGKLLWDHAFDYAKSRGYKRTMCLTTEEKLFNKYTRFGMNKNIPCVSFVKEL